MTKLVGMIAVMALITGCQMAPSGSSRSVLDNQTFMSMWGTYQRCVSSGNLDQLRTDVALLMDAPIARRSQSDFTVPLPEMITRHVSAQPTRVAADPRAMSAACSVHTAEVALQNGKNEVAVQLMNDLVRTHSTGEYAYYIQQANAILHRVQPTALHVSQPSGSGSIRRQMLPAPAVNAPRAVAPDASDSIQYE